MSKKLEWGGVPELPPPKNPYRDTLLVYGALALVILIVAWLTGGSVGQGGARRGRVLRDRVGLDDVPVPRQGSRRGGAPARG